MGRMVGMLRRLRALLRRGRAEREMDEEIRLHLHYETEKNVRAGMSPEEARRRAVLAFGGVEKFREEVREARGLPWLERLGQDLRYALRGLRRSPGFALVAVLTLALGIGANTAIFGVVDAALLRPLPFPEPERLVVIWGVAGPERDIRGASYPEVRDWAEMTRSLEEVSIYDETTLDLGDDGEAEQLEAEIVSPSYFRLLGAEPLLGRGLLPEDDRPGIAPPVVISADLWRRRFEARRDVLGRSVTLNSRQAVVVGVMPPEFRGLSFDTEIWTPLLPWDDEASNDRGSRWLAALARVRPGVPLQRAQAEVEETTERLEALHPATNRERRADLISLHEYHLDTTRTLLLVLLGAVGLLLLIACVNVLNLQLVRGLTRGREVAVRFALGATRARVVRQLVTESLTLAVLGGIVGVVLAYWGTRSLLTLVPEGVLPAYVEVGLDLRMLLFAALLVGFTGAVSGLAPALRSSRAGLTGQLGERAGKSGRSSVRLQEALVAAEVALAVVLMVAAAVMVRSLREQLEIQPGFQPDGVVAARLRLPQESYAPEERIRFVERVLEELRGVPGVTSVAVGSDAPLRGNNSAAIVRVEGREHGVRYYRHRVTPEYFATLGIPVVRGRGFDERDGRDAPPVAVVSTAFAERLWPGEDPVGRSLLMAPDGPPVTVVGVAGNVHFRDLTTSLVDPGEDPDLYLPYAQQPTGTFDILLRSAGTARLALDPLQRTVAGLDPRLPVYQVQSMTEALRAQTANDRFGSVLLTIFGLLALALAAIGLYGVMAFVVQSQRREMAIRIAVGAEPGQVLRLVLRRGILIASGGAVVGLVAAIQCGRFVAGLLYGVEPADPLSLASVVLVLLATAALANLLPARRAASVEPALTLRQD